MSFWPRRRLLVEEPARPLSPAAGTRVLALLRSASRRASASRPLALVVLCVGVLADLVEGGDLGLLVVPPLLAVLALDIVGTSVVSGLCVASSLAYSLSQGGAGPFWHRFGHVVTVAIVAALAIWLTHLRDERERLLTRLATIARVAQEAIVQAPAAHIGDTAFAARYVASQRDATVGGDLYEAVVTPFGVRVLIGDVRGKGLDAVHHAATVLRAYRRRSSEVAELQRLAAEINDDVDGALSSDEFVTAVFAELRPSGVLDLVNCGHPDPVCVSREGSYLLQTSHRTTPLGLAPTTHVDRFRLEHGDRVLFYTDGLFEIGRHPNRRLLEATDRLLRRPDLEGALDDLIVELVGDPGKADDDVAVLLMEHRPSTRSFTLRAL